VNAWHAVRVFRLVGLLVVLAATRARADVACEACDSGSSGVGVLALTRSGVFGDVDYVNADASAGIALRAGGRIAVGRTGFLEGELPIGFHEQWILGNVTVRAGVLPRGRWLAAAALRISAPTTPTVGAGLAATTALAAPRIVDPELFVSHLTSIELVADWRWPQEITWLQLETGVAGWWRPDQPAGAVQRASIAGGVRVESWLDLTASFVTRSFVLVHDSREDFVHSLILGIIAHQRRGQIALRLEVPIDKSARDANRFLVGLEARGW
jgi:hypothetical protein